MRNNKNKAIGYSDFYKQNNRTDSMINYDAEKETDDDAKNMVERRKQALKRRLNRRAGK